MLLLKGLNSMESGPTPTGIVPVGHYSELLITVTPAKELVT